MQQSIYMYDKIDLTLTQLLQTACEVTNGYISRSELNGTISAGGTGAVMHSIQPHGIDPIIPLFIKKYPFKKIHCTYL